MGRPGLGRGGDGAMTKFAGILAVDRLTGEILQNPVNDHRDAFHQSVALDALVQWVHNEAVCQAVEKERAAALRQEDRTSSQRNRRPREEVLELYADCLRATIGRYSELRSATMH